MIDCWDSLWVMDRGTKSEHQQSNMTAVVQKGRKKKALTHRHSLSWFSRMSSGGTIEFINPAVACTETAACSARTPSEFQAAPGQLRVPTSTLYGLPHTYTHPPTPPTHGIGSPPKNTKHAMRRCRIDVEASAMRICGKCSRTPSTNAGGHHQWHAPQCTTTLWLCRAILAWNPVPPGIMRERYRIDEAVDRKRHAMEAPVEAHTHRERERGRGERGREQLVQGDLTLRQLRSCIS
jgi:hypothetical protein